MHPPQLPKVRWYDRLFIGFVFVLFFEAATEAWGGSLPDLAWAVLLGLVAFCLTTLARRSREEWKRWEAHRDRLS